VSDIIDIVQNIQMLN